MSDFTYENKECNKTGNIYERYEWDNVWIEYAIGHTGYHVLYIGDSISCQTRRIATAQTEERILFDGFGTSKGIDNPYFKNAIDVFAKQLPATDLVIFNNGLHGYHLNDTEEYGFYYEEMVRFLMERFQNVPLYIALTTCVRNEDEMKRMIQRNKTASEIADRHQIPVIDLFTITAENKHLLKEDGVHFLPEGYELVASTIIDAISGALPKRW